MSFVVFTFKTVLSTKAVSIKKPRDCRSFANAVQQRHSVKLEEVRRFLVDSLKAVGAPEAEAKAQADMLLHADSVGHFNQGLSRIELYINDCKSGSCVPAAKPKILKETKATAWVDGQIALGATVSNFCMDLAIKKAKDAGIGWVSAKRSNHNGMAGYWALKAEREGLIGLAFTNSSAIMIPTRAKRCALGSNPIAMAAPGRGGDKILIDMSSAAFEYKVVPEPGAVRVDWSLGPDGRPVTDPTKGTGLLMPLGGEEKTSGYKGFCLGALVEMFCSGLSGSTLGHKIQPWSIVSQMGPTDLGQCFAAINPDCFAPGFPERVDEYLRTWRNLDPLDPELPVMAPGDREEALGKETKAKGTISYPHRLIKSVAILAKKLGVKPVETEFVEIDLGQR